MPDLSLESGIHQRGIQFVAGVDEAGRGPLAGPVVAAAVILPPDLTGDEPWLQCLDDSKKLTHTRRQRAVETVYEHALAVGVGMVSARRRAAVHLWALPEPVETSPES